MPSPPSVHDKITFDRKEFTRLLQALKERGYTVIGPTVRDGAIIYDEVAAAEDLPVGWQDEQEGGKYRLSKRDDDALFGYNVGPHSWKKYLHPPRMRLWQAQRNGKSFEVVQDDDKPPKYAFIGVRSCELSAIAVQDRVFMGDRFTDPVYKARREPIFTVAVNCGQAGNTCFCASMDTGPKAKSGFDLALTEIIEGKKHFFVVEIGSETGAEVIKDIPHESAAEDTVQQAEDIVENTASQMGRQLNTEGLPGLLMNNLDHPRWDDVATRCLSCANCTMACPTCFCTTVEDTTDLSGDHAERWQHWDSCFTMDFTYIHGGSVRPNTRSRYRQWMTHKLSTWHDQFGTSGCVGCGRCITWCPVGIDITEEAAAIRETEGVRSN